MDLKQYLQEKKEIMISQPLIMTTIAEESPLE